MAGGGDLQQKSTSRLKRSIRERERKKLYDAKRRRSKLAHELHDVLHVTHVPQFLDGDDPISLPPYIRFLLSLGPKYTPHMAPSVAFERYHKAVFGELANLERVLLWNAYFLTKKDNDKPNFYETMPYKRLHISKGTLFPKKLLDECGSAGFAIPSCVAHARDTMVCAFSSTKLTELPRRGVGLCWPMVRDFTKDYVIVSGDKDCSHTIMTISAYQSEVAVHLRGMTPDGLFRYVKLGTHASDLDWWLDRAKQWMSMLHDVMVSFLPHELVDFIDVFLRMQPPPSFPSFYLLCKSHKGLTYRMGHWPSRSIVGMVKWATTSSSIILSVIGTMFLSLDRTLHPQFAPLVDTLDFVNRLHTFDANFGFASGDYAITVVDFSNMYSNFLWEDVRDAWRFWMSFFRRHHGACAFSAHEQAFAQWLFTPLPRDLFDQCTEVFLFLHIPYCDAMTLGEFVLACVFTHTLFVVPGKGLHRQRAGFPMGTNAAPPFANLIDRYYELLCPLPSLPGFMHGRFIDDLCLIHPRSWAPRVCEHFRRCYPPHLPFEVQHFN